jgi:hypothetical protein
LRIELHSDAEEELHAAAAWYDDQRPGLGDELLAEVDRWLVAISESPGVWPAWPGIPGTEPVIRRALLDRFPYAIAYQVSEDKLVILAIAHTSRRPLYWSRRAEEKAEP